jgi:hypothetical protein
MPLWLAYLIIVCAALWTDCDTVRALAPGIRTPGVADAPGVGALRRQAKAHAESS